MSVFIVDAHQNIAYNAQQLGRDFTQWSLHQRHREHGLDVPPSMTGLPDNLLGRVGIVFASLKVVPEASSYQKAWEQMTYVTARQAYQQAMWQMDYYKRLDDESAQVKLILTQDDLDTVVQSWEEGTAIDDHVQGMVVLMEGADPILEPKQFEEWVEHGVRIVAPAWQQTRYASGAGDEGELTLPGYELLDVMASYQVILDLSHLSERAYQQAIERYEGEIIVSHANPRYFHDSSRCLSDDMIRRLAERDGVMGIMMYNRYLRKDWHRTDPKRHVGISHVVDVVDYVCQLTGTVDHVGIGSDIDGGYAYRDVPDEIDSSSDLWQLQAGLQARGFAEDDVHAILGGNMLRKLRQTLPV